MNQVNFLFIIGIASLLLSGCTGVRNSYESLLDKNTAKPVITLQVKEKREILVVGNGYPGWWGYKPGIISQNPEIASIECEKGRSFIPFREPGIIFGGETCYLKTRKPGVAWLLIGNEFILESIIEEINRNGLAEDNHFPFIPDGANMWIKLNVLGISEP
ncbi:MAG: hypothetical protein KAT06_07040 [Gammaproteobacteria bacterium]|nr:hypothetical protein [Gammaproteobacteria bacterium]